jgi:hypothetical protein
MGLVTSVRGMYNKWVIAERVHLLVNVYRERCNTKGNFLSRILFSVSIDLAAKESFAVNWPAASQHRIFTHVGLRIFTRYRIFTF